MNKTGRRLLSILLALTMVLGLLPGMSLTAYAEIKNIGVGITYAAGDVVDFGSSDVYCNTGGTTPNKFKGQYTVL